MRKVSVVVKPGSKKGDSVVENLDGSLTVTLRARPVDGAANTALVEVLSEYYDVPKTNIEIARGGNARKKLIKIFT